MRVSDRFTEDLLRAFWWAQVEARGQRHSYCGVEDLLCGIALSRERITSEILSDSGMTVRGIQSHSSMLGNGACGATEDDIPLTPNAKRAFDLALEVAERFASQQIDCGHVLYALVSEPFVGDLGSILQALKVNPEQLRHDISLRLRDIGGATS